jgi:hypothetical protein
MKQQLAMCLHNGGGAGDNPIISIGYCRRCDLGRVAGGHDVSVLGNAVMK